MSPEMAYLANLALSQARAHAVLSTCLELVPGPEGTWARERATAIGYSSSHPVLVDGQEDKAKSRRVVFRVDFSLDEVIAGIEDDVQADSVKRQLFEEMDDAVPPSPDGTAPPVSPMPSPALGATADRANAATAAPAIEQAGAPAIAPAAIAMASDGAIVGVASVIDADTLEIHGQRVRLHGIDAPEGRQSCLDAADLEFRCGQQAAMALSDYIGRQTISCAPRDIDRYGRTVAVCRVGDEDLGAWLVNEGLAFAYRRYSTDYVGLEDEARLNRRGLWAGSFDFPWDVR
jgi:endonuclease YncB( thermonuclease family)